MIAKGVDENGDEFEQTIHINKINPRNASLVEMTVLESYMGVDKNRGLTLLPPGTGMMGLSDRTNSLKRIWRNGGLLHFRFLDGTELEIDTEEE